MKSFLLLNLLLLIASSLFGEVVIDFSKGRFIEKPDKQLSLTKVSAVNENDKPKSSKDTVNSRSILTLPEDKMTSEEWNNEIKKNPWKKWVLLDSAPVTNDFVNTTSNVVVITFLDYEGAAKNGISDIGTIREKYKLCCVLHPGDKYVETNDGKNGYRLARYLQIYDYCESAKQYIGSNVMNFDADKDGLTSYEEVIGTNIILSVNGELNNYNIITFPRVADSDKDGINDGDEIRGKNEFVTDPNNPDTDGDGIPDKEDKDPTMSCKYDDPVKMPTEWVEYWSKGDVELYKKLLLKNDDCDSDGLSNWEEKILETDPTEANRESFLVFPRCPILKNIDDDLYETEINFLIRTNIMMGASLQVFWAYTGDKPKFKHVSSTPLREKPFRLNPLYSEHTRQQHRSVWTSDKYCVKEITFQPMTIHKMKITYKNDSWFYDMSLGINYYDPKNRNAGFEQKTINFKTLFNKSFIPEKIPDIPVLKSPAAGIVFFQDENITCKWDKADIDKFWDLCVVEYRTYCLQPFLKDWFRYADVFTNNWGLGLNTYNNDLFVFEKQNLRNDFLTMAIGMRIVSKQHFSLIGEYIPIFKTRRLSEDCSFVFKPDTLKNIRLQAMYGKFKSKEAGQSSNE